MNRRAVISLLGGVAAWPQMLLAQPASKRPLIAWLSGGAQPATAVFVDAFLQGMRDHGYVEGRNFGIVYRYADGYVERLPALAQELVRLNPAVILAPASGPAVAAKQVTATIPIVTPALADAVHLGLIASEARPGGNVTGIMPYVPGLPAKQIELAREVVSGAGRIGVLANSDDAKGPPQLRELQAAGRAIGATVVAAEAATPGDLDGALQKLQSQDIAVVIVLQTSMLLSERRRIAAAAAAMRLPAIYGYREHVDAGGLISYGVDLHDCFRRSAAYVHKILNGTAPGDLPVEFPTKLELIINLKTAKALGLELAPTLIARAYEVIE
jgi:putative tryptophan/tyrosine transport system substrate-binding protein